MNHPLLNACLLLGGMIFLILGGYVRDIGSYDIVGLGFVVFAVIHFCWMCHQVDKPEPIEVMKK